MSELKKECQFTVPASALHEITKLAKRIKNPTVKYSSDTEKMKAQVIESSIRDSQGILEIIEVIADGKIEQYLKILES